MLTRRSRRDNQGGVRADPLAADPPPPRGGGRPTEEAGTLHVALIGLYPNPELKGVAQEVETTLVLIMDEAAR